MSGGYFDNKQKHLIWIAGEIGDIVKDNDRTEPDNYGQFGFGIDSRAIGEFQKLAELLPIIKDMIDQVDLLTCDDINEKSFIKNFSSLKKSIVNKIGMCDE